MAALPCFAVRKAGETRALPLRDHLDMRERERLAALAGLDPARRAALAAIAAARPREHATIVVADQAREFLAELAQLMATIVEGK
jgi:hypothetical protein